MKYYVYLSDAKVDMLYSQIPDRLRDKLAAELKIDLKVFSTKFSKEPSDKTKFAKLQLTEDFIEKNFDIGTVDSPEFFFRGTMLMRWGSLHSSRTAKDFHNTNIVFFGGITARTILGLAGSSKHVIGEMGNSEPELKSGSQPPYILEVLRGKVRESKRLVDTSTLDESLYDIAHTVRKMEGPEQKLEFLAKRLLTGIEQPERRFPLGRKRRKILLGSPIYVALVE